MKKFVSAVGIVALTLSIAVPASAQTKERSKGRTWAGVALMAGGLFVAFSKQSCGFTGPATDTVTVLGVQVTWNYEAQVQNGRCLVGGIASLRNGTRFDLDLESSWENFQGEDTVAKNLGPKKDFTAV